LNLPLGVLRDLADLIVEGSGRAARLAALVADGVLLTTDHDFDHLGSAGLRVERILEGTLK
jgi:hypothetical protein